MQWDKVDCADIGIIKVNLLDLGMIAAIEEPTTIIRSRSGSCDLATIPPKGSRTYKWPSRPTRSLSCRLGAEFRWRRCRASGLPVSMTWS